MTIFSTWSRKAITVLVLSIGCMNTGVQALEEAPLPPDTEFTFGIVPQQSAHKLALTWQPLFDEIERSSGIRLVFKTASNIPIFEERLAQGDYDLAYMNPYHFTVFNDSPGYQAVAKAANKAIKGIVVVHKDSEIQSLNDLDQSTIAFPAPGAFAASVIPRSYLANEGIAIEPTYVQTHDSVYLTVAQGIYPAGGGVLRTFNSMPQTTKDQLRILWTTPGYTPHAIAIHPRFGDDERKAILNALMALTETQAGQQALQQLQIDAWEAAENADWDDVRALNIQSLTD